MAKPSRRTAAFSLSLFVPIDDQARDGGFKLVLAEGQEFAIVRWDGARWVFSSGVPLNFVPTDYRRG